jgi:hypothetical protein
MKPKTNPLDAIAEHSAPARLRPGERLKPFSKAKIAEKLRGIRQRIRNFRYRCDRCGEDGAVGRPPRLTLKASDNINRLVANQEYDLCENCARSWKNFIESKEAGTRRSA